MAVGTYTGNGAATQDVTTVGFQPDYTIVLPDNAESPVFRYAAMPADYSNDFDGGSQCAAGCSRSPESGIQTELANGFRVGTYVNVNANVYHYIAWKQTPGRIKVGTYTGDSNDNRSIAGVGFRPEFVTVSNGVTPIPNTSTVFKTAATGTSSDYSLVYVAYAPGYQGPDNIQAIQADGFQVGTDDNVNAFNEPLYYAAFGPGLPDRGGDELPLDRRGRNLRDGTGHGRQRLLDGDRNRDAVGHGEPRARGLHHDHRAGNLHGPGSRLGELAGPDHRLLRHDRHLRLHDRPPVLDSGGLGELHRRESLRVLPGGEREPRGRRPKRGGDRLQGRPPRAGDDQRLDDRRAPHDHAHGRPRQPPPGRRRGRSGRGQWGHCRGRGSGG